MHSQTGSEQGLRVSGANLRDDDLPCLNPPYAKPDRPCVRLFKHPLSGHVERVTRRQIMSARVDGTSSEGTTSNTLDLTPPEVDVTKATIRAWPAKLLT